jgi:2-dehydro-3-deoxyphosphogluconate aldolase/(4S)-4-hydroxy-2-oxoglutarate aldolase
VTPDTIAEFVRAGALAAFAGSSLIDDSVLRQRNWDALTERAEAFALAIRSLPQLQDLVEN